ncbi:MAG: MBL fold metallo-hydrolase [Rhodospirillaceae bacterium]|jgi:glyoxylase-like metal-dependent hydrolase (beta-lactamase superfamily II)|nr:MBL fold metallo-hydrolase [Rhodospirillaceae bacterium]
MIQQNSLRFVIVPVTNLAQNCSIIWCSETNVGAVIDPGGNVDKIIKKIDVYKPIIEKILVTHGHFDHAGHVAELSTRLNIPIEGPNINDSFLIETIAEHSNMVDNFQYRSFFPNRWLEDGDTVTIGNQILNVMHCPGHTPGHVVFFHDKSKLAFVGDVIFAGSIGRTDFPRGNQLDLINSIVTKLLPLGDDVTFIPGHGPFSTFGQERQTNPYISDQKIGMFSSS